jgi:2,3-bisphosphoglycerate-independent phosphoglycerate mutase
MRLLFTDGATGTYNTNFLAKAKTAVQALKKHDFVLVHVKAPDLAGHDHDPRKKRDIIKSLDTLVSHILAHVDLDDTIIALTTDHTTSSVKGEHSGEPVPLAILGPNVRRDDVKEFDEISCARGGLNRIKGRDLMPILMNLLGKATKAGS